MRHQKKKITLDRKIGPRRALLKHLAQSLILFEKVVTTKAKAKAAQPLVENLITKAKHNTLATRRQLVAALDTVQAVKKLMEVLGPRYVQRAGGYTRITAIGNRKGDGAPEATIELV